MWEIKLDSIISNYGDACSAIDQVGQGSHVRQYYHLILLVILVVVVVVVVRSSSSGSSSNSINNSSSKSESDGTEIEIDKEIKILYHLLSIIYEFVQRLGSSIKD